MSSAKRCAPMTTRLCAAWFGRLISWHIDAGPVASLRACRCVLSASITETTRAMISTCSGARLVGPVTVETVMSCERVGKSELANPAMLTGAASDIFSCVLSMTVSI